MQPAKKGDTLRPEIMEVIRAYAAGLSYKQIASNLKVSTPTVHKRLQAGREKINALSNVNMVHILTKEGSI